MQADIQQPLKELRVDGGASQNDMLMQFQADILNVPVLRPKMQESTAWGAAAMAGLKCGVFSSLDEIAQSWQLERAFEPKMSPDQREFHLQQWQSALKRAKSELWLFNAIVLISQNIIKRHNIHSKKPLLKAVFYYPNAHVRHRLPLF